MVPNLYATFAHSENALGYFLTLANGKSSPSKKEQQVNECSYYLAAHKAISGGQGLSSDQILELREGYASFDAKLNALAEFAAETAINRGKPSESTVQALLSAGYSRESVIGSILMIGEITVTNYLHGITKVTVDFPAVPSLVLA